MSKHEPLWSVFVDSFATGFLNVWTACTCVWASAGQFTVLWVLCLAFVAGLQLLKILLF